MVRVTPQACRGFRFCLPAFALRRVAHPCSPLPLSGGDAVFSFIARSASGPRSLRTLSRLRRIGSFVGRGDSLERRFVQLGLASREIEAPASPAVDLPRGPTCCVFRRLARRPTRPARVARSFGFARRCAAAVRAASRPYGLRYNLSARWASRGGLGGDHRAVRIRFVGEWAVVGDLAQARRPTHPARVARSLCFAGGWRRACGLFPGLTAFAITFRPVGPFGWVAGISRLR